MYHVNTQIDGNNKCVNYTISSMNRTSTAPTDFSKQLFYSNETALPQHTNEDYQVDSGFPRNCFPIMRNCLLDLEPDILPDDRFYPLPSGSLIVPHRFWLLSHEDHCIEDVYYNNDFNKVSTNVLASCTNSLEFGLLFILGEKGCGYLYR